MVNRKYISLIVAVVVLVIYVGVGLFFVFLRRPPAQKPEVVTPTPAVIISPARSRPPVAYDQEAEEKLLEIIRTRPQLSPDDTAARQRLLNLLGNESGILLRTPLYIIEYVKTADEFFVEILTTDFNPAKEEATKWFQDQGLSKKGVCNLPVVFYLNRDSSNQLRGRGVVFNTLPEGC